MSRGWTRRLVAAGAALVVAGMVGCTRSDADIARERDTLRAAVTAIPPIAAVHPEGAYADFDAGCHSFAECVDSDERPAVYTVALRLDPGAGADPAAQCRHFVSALARHGIRLVTVWRGTRAVHAVTATLPASWYGDGVQPRWIDVTDHVCASGHVHSAVMVDQHGGSPASTAHLVLNLYDPYDGDPPSYQAVAEAVSRGHDPADRRVERLPVDTPPPTPSQLAYLRARIDQPLVIAADPSVDGIGTSSHTADTWIVPPALTDLRFAVACTVGDTVTLGVWDATVQPVGRGSSRTEECAGRPLDILLAVPTPIIDIDIAVHQQPRPGSPTPHGLHHPYTVQVTPLPG